MASKALTSSASSLMPNKASLSPASLGSVPRSVFLCSPLKSSTSASKVLLQVNAQQRGGEFFSSTPSQGGSNVPYTTSGQGSVHTPWYTTEDETAIKMRIDMPGMAPEDLDVKVEGNMLVIKDLGRQIYSPYDTKIPLPPDCVKEQVQATLRNGVLHVSVPKRFPPSTFHIPVRSTPY